MKKLLIILTIGLFGLAVNAQEEEHNDKIRDRMKEFIQKRLGLTKNEAERFTPVFLRYFKEWRETLREQKDPLFRQQKITEVRIRYRNEFREIIGEKRSNEVYRHQEKFIAEIAKLRRERIESRQPTPKRLNALNR
jgi:hypothetical protein